MSKRKSSRKTEAGAPSVSLEYACLETVLKQLGMALKTWQNNPNILPVRTFLLGRRRVVKISDVNQFFENQIME